MTARFKALVTGASGGIGQAIVDALLADGHYVLATGRRHEALVQLRQRHVQAGDRLETVTADLTQADDRERLVTAARDWRGGINVLVNNAGFADFGLLENQSPEQIDRLLMLNLQVPIVLTQALLPLLQSQSSAHILNVGSVFGAIGYPGNAVYCASKFGLRGFTEAVRRELVGTSVAVHLLAPRATRTSFNDSAVESLNQALGNQVDTPEAVAAELIRRLSQPSGSTVIGFPEKIFARVNAVLPSLVDRALRKQLPIIRRYAAIRRSS